MNARRPWQTNRTELSADCSYPLFKSFGDQSFKFSFGGIHYAIGSDDFCKMGQKIVLCFFVFIGQTINACRYNATGRLETLNISAEFGKCCCVLWHALAGTFRASVVQDQIDFFSVQMTIGPRNRNQHTQAITNSRPI